MASLEANGPVSLDSGISSCSCPRKTGLWWPLWGALLRSGNKVSVYLAGKKSWACAMGMVSLVWGRCSWFKSRPFLLYVDAVDFGKCINRQICTNRGQREGIPLLPLFKPKHTGVLSGSQTLMLNAMAQCPWSRNHLHIPIIWELLRIPLSNSQHIPIISKWLREGARHRQFLKIPKCSHV